MLQLRASGVPVEHAAATDLSQLYRSSTEICRSRSSREVNRNRCSRPTPCRVPGKQSIYKTLPHFLQQCVCLQCCLPDMPCSLQLKAVLEAHAGCNAISLGCAGARVGVRPGPARPLSSPCEGGRFSALWSKEYRTAS